VATLAGGICVTMASSGLASANVLAPLPSTARPNREFAQLSAYAVKHMAQDHGPLATTMKDVRRAPFSFTSNEPEASEAALGNDIYVIEVRSEPKGARSYWLGYKYRAYEKYPPAGNGLWRERFKYKNAGRPGERGEGFYFDVPVEITDPVVSAWLREKPPGMVQLPVEFIAGVEALASDPANGAKRFA
jgi:hypothetical protein